MAATNRSERRSRRKTKTVSITLQNRGQTTQDFAVGIGIFLLAMAFVFSYVPSIITPYSSSMSGETAKADRVAATVLDDLEETNQPNHLNGSAFDQTYVGSNSSELAAHLGLRATDTVSIDNVNVSIEQLNQSIDREDRRLIGGGDEYRSGSSAASSARIVTVDFDGVAVDAEECDPACRLVVRVW